MKKINVGIDISKEKLNLCYQMDLKTVREEEIVNDVKVIKNSMGLTRALRELSHSERFEDTLKLLMTVPGIGQTTGLA